MFKLILLFLVTASTLFSQIAFVFACDASAGVSASAFLTDCAQSSGGKAVVPNNSDGQDGVRELVKKIAERVIQFGALFAIGAIVFSGMRYVTSTGDDERVKGAKNTLIYAVIGLLLLLTAFPFVDVIIRFIYSLGN